jgi:MFS transporter, OCT family, solute carrier family 22 (organic cation transporter), member 16
VKFHCLTIKILLQGNLGGNPFFNLFIMSLVEIPSYIAVIILLDRLGRRSITSSFMLIGGLACIVAVFLAEKSTEATTTVFVGKLFIAGSFAVRISLNLSQVFLTYSTFL